MIKTIIVEDDLMVASLNTQFAYKTPGIEVIAAFHNGRDALAFMKDNKADLLLLDLYMPDVTGLEILKTLRGRGDHVGAIMITAANDAAHIEEALRLGIVDYLVKPFRYERFAAAIQKFSRQRALMEKEGNFTQEDIDRLISPPNFLNGDNTGLQKGMQRKTLDMVRACLKEHQQEFLTSEQIAGKIGLSKVTVRHYLNYLIECHEAVSRINYLTGGHPSIEYSASSGANAPS